MNHRITLPLLAAVLGTLCAPFQAAGGSDDPTSLVRDALSKNDDPFGFGATTPGPKPAAPPPAPAPAPATASAPAAPAPAPAPAVTLEAAKQQLFANWQTSIELGQAQTLAGDLTCDGSNDYFVGWSDLGGSAQRGYHLAVVYHDGDRLAYHHTVLPLGGTAQYAVCQSSADARPSVTLTGHPINAAERAAYGLPASCPGVVRLEDQRCDAIYIGWNPTAKQFILVRN